MGYLTTDQLETAKQLTLAAIEKMDLHHTVQRKAEEHNEYVANEISKVFRAMCLAVEEGQKGSDGSTSYKMY